MKKRFSFNSIFLLTLFFYSTSMAQDKIQEERPVLSTPSFQLLVTGNMGYLSGNSDMNNFTESCGDIIAEYYNDIAESQSEPRDWSISDHTKANMNLGGELELRFFGKSFGFGAGAGIHYAESKAGVTSPSWGNKPEYTLSLLVIPLTGTVYYIQSLSENCFFTMGAGAGYYFSFLDGVIDSNDTVAYDAGVPEPTADTGGIGYHIKADLNYNMGGLTITAGIMGRYASFDSFEEDGYEYDIEAGLSGLSIYMGAGFSI